MCEIKLLLFDTHHKSKDSKVFLFEKYSYFFDNRNF